jgi:hypothetical protein
MRYPPFKPALWVSSGTGWNVRVEADPGTEQYSRYASPYYIPLCTIVVQIVAGRGVVMPFNGWDGSPIAKVALDEEAHN